VKNIVVATRGLGDAFSLTPGQSACPPDAPTNVVATTGDATATVSFTPPAADGGATVTSYTVTSSPDQITATDVASPVQVTGLTNGVTYTFTVVAKNSAGVSGPSLPSNAATPATTFLPPAQLIASASSPTSVTIDWSAAAGADHYVLLRSSLGTPFGVVVSQPGFHFVDTSLDPNTTYVYVVRSVDGSNNASADSERDVATTMFFTDDPLTSGVAVKAVHIAEIRAGVNAMRAAASLTPATFMDHALDSSSVIKAVHLTEIRTALDEARSALLLPSLSYNTVTAGTTGIHWFHLQQIRDAVK